MFGALPRNWLGYVSRTDRKLAIKSGVKGLERLDTIVHECLHACYPDLNEDAVNDGAGDMARLLWRLGYRDTFSDEETET